MAELEVSKRSLEPAGYKAAAVTIDKALAHFGVPDNWDKISEDYLEEIAALPADILPDIWVYVRRNCKFFPKIPDLLEHAQLRIFPRVVRKCRLEAALTYFR